MLFFILIGALMFANFVNFTTMPADLRDLVTRWQLPPLGVVAAICVIYVILGTAMEELSMILLTVPLFFPVVTELGFDPIWFGILIVVVVQIGLISPPVGMNIFVVKNLIRGASIGTIYRGVAPFSIALILLLALVVAVPELALWLPERMD
jgi:TRAP-type C4-dicarboxylate transport system permease large subunit